MLLSYELNIGVVLISNSFAGIHNSQKKVLFNGIKNDRLFVIVIDNYNILNKTYNNMENVVPSYGLIQKNNTTYLNTEEVLNIFQSKENFIIIENINTYIKFSNFKYKRYQKLLTSAKIQKNKSRLEQSKTT